MPARQEFIEHVAGLITGQSSNRILRVAIDGVDGAGKTTFVDEVAAVIRSTGRAVIRASVDAFHHPRKVRYRRGRSSPEGFFLDSYDYGALREALLNPLSPGGSRCFRTGVFDDISDLPKTLPEQFAPLNAVLLLEGIFLHRAELHPY